MTETRSSVSLHFHTIDTIRNDIKDYSIIIKQRISGHNQKPEYRLLNDTGLCFILSNGESITIPKNFTWDGSSSPRFLWSLLGSDGDFEIAAIIHDYLYENRLYGREFADKEMLLWSKAVNGTLNKVSFRNIDNYLRYYAVRLFGQHAWNT